MPIKLLDAGGKYMMSGTIREEVEAELKKYQERGSITISVVQKVGSLWVAACSIPKGAATVDSTQTLNLADIQKSSRDSEGTAEPEFNDGCTVTEFGFKRVITGPTKLAVEQRIQFLKQFGVDILVEPGEQGDAWEAVVDVGGADKAFRY